MSSAPRVGTSRRSPQQPLGWHSVIDVGPSLLDAPAAGSRPDTARRLRAQVLHLVPGAVDMEALAPEPDNWIGLFVLDGLLLVELDAGRAQTGWLVGGDDLVRPWEIARMALAHATKWRVLSPTRVARLDSEFSIRAGGIPMLARALVKRTAQTTNWLLAKSLVMASPAVEDKLLLAFALFAERWGKVNHDGILLKLPLTHALLATLCGVRRPSVTIALRSLAARDLLTRTAEGDWLLHRRCTDDASTRPSSWPHYAATLGLAEAANAAHGAS